VMMDGKCELVAALRRFGEILSRADAACAESVEINGNANDGSNEPANPPCIEDPWVWRWTLCARTRD
jgi:hypothetical protein